MTTKNAINKRFIKAVGTVIEDGLAKNKKEISLNLGISPSRFSEILNERMNVGLDIIQNFCNQYSVNYYYIFENSSDFYAHLNAHLNAHLQPKNQGFSELSQKDNNVCESCQEKERIIIALEGQVKVLTQTAEDLRQDKERLLKSSENTHSSKRNSA